MKWYNGRGMRCWLLGRRLTGEGKESVNGKRDESRMGGRDAVKECKGVRRRIGERSV